LDTNYLENNYLTLVGKVTSEKKFSHEIYGERFYSFDLLVPRLSGAADVIPVTVSERLITDDMMEIGTKLLIKGQFRSYNSYENEKNKLILTVFAKDIEKLEEKAEDDQNVETAEVDENGEPIEMPKRDFFKKDYITNEVVLIGYICKKPVYRQTPFGREIADLLLAVNRAYNKSDYIPSIAWGRNARFCQNMEVGTEVKIVGRVQSRNYEKKLEDGSIVKKVAYEVSVGSLEIIKQAENRDEEIAEQAEDTTTTVEEAM
jgi:single-stranded DNA-binding protein